MKRILVLAGLALVHATAVAQPGKAAPVVAQNFKVSLDGKELPAVSEISSVKEAGASLKLMLLVTRTTDTTLDQWMQGKGEPRNVRIDFLNAALSERVAGYDYSGCTPLKFEWSVSAAERGLAKESWTLQCSALKRN